MSVYLRFDLRHQVLVFVHARNATIGTANALLEIARERNETSFFSCQNMDGYDAANKQVGFEAFFFFFICKLFSP